MAGLREKLMAFLDRSVKYPFAWGQHDCMLELADWLDFSCKMDVGSRWRGLYDSEASLDALLDGLGGFETAMTDEAAALGLVATAEPKFGDVGLVTLAGQDKPLGAILMPSGRWRMKTLQGIALRSPDAVTVLVAWSLPCRPSLPQPS